MVTPSSYTIEVSQPPLEDWQIAVIVLSIMGVTAVVCFFIGRKTFKRGKRSDDLLRINSYMCYFIAAMLLYVRVAASPGAIVDSLSCACCLRRIGPVILIGVGLGVGAATETVIVWILPTIGGVWMLIVLFLCGHTSVELDAKKKTVSVVKFYCVVWPMSAKSYPMSEVVGFETSHTLVRTRNSNTGQWSESTTSQVMMRLKSGQKIKVDGASSNVGGYSSSVSELNGFLASAKGEEPDSGSTRGADNNRTCTSVPR